MVLLSKKAFLLLFGPLAVRSGSSERKDRNLRVLDQQPDSRELQKQPINPPNGPPIDIPPNDPEQCIPGVCDPIQDPVTNPQFKAVFVPALNTTDPFCINFNDEGDTEGFAPCPGHFDNIEVNVFGSPSPDPHINPLRNDLFLHLRDRSHASLACGTGPDYTGDWSEVASAKCYNLCFDVNLFYDGCHSGVPNCQLNPATGGYFIPVYPTIILQGGAPNYYRATFRANEHMTDKDGDNPGWHRICAPLEPLDPDGNLPENEVGKWYMGAPNDILSGLPPVTGGSPSPNSAWPALLADIAAIELPVDYTSNPAERVGFDHICLEEGECTDPCDPEPLCYWKHEWQCEHAKKEPWYTNFTKLVNYVETFDIRKLCICDIFNNCCPDLCDIAEQELLALLLNIASGEVSPECGVKECGDCFHSVKDIVEIVDKLLSRSARSNYDCSTALKYLTGINEDEELCDSPGDCPQSERCRESGGRCVSQKLCDPNDPSVFCVDQYCEERDCTCMIVDTPPVSCEQTERCKLGGGKCVSKDLCDETKPGVTCEDDFCEVKDGCTCMIVDDPPVDCKQTEECKLRGGRCASKGLCDENKPGVLCEDDLCPDDDCTCIINEDPSVDCKQDQVCTNRGGRCASKELCDDQQPGVFCVDDVCPDDDCTCMIVAIPPPGCEQTEECKERLGECVSKELCIATGGVLCEDEICPEEDCTCMIRDTPPPGCQQTDECKLRGGQCVSKDICVTTPFALCEDDICPQEDCTCMIERATPSPLATPSPVQPTITACLQTEKCLLREGTCVSADSCTEIPGSVICDKDDCYGDHCVCKIGSPKCEQTYQCAHNNGTCVKAQDCVGDCRPELCNGAEDCTCQIPDDRPPCKTGKACLGLGTGGVCTRDCEPNNFVQCAAACEEPGCECKNCLQTDPDCLKRGGKCMLEETCIETAASNPKLQCDRGLCGKPGDCACLLPKPACELTKACAVANGACVTNCQESNSITCGTECLDSANPIGNECRCLKCKETKPCAKMNGSCTPFCIPSAGFFCDASLCDLDGSGKSICSCKYPIGITSPPIQDAPQLPKPGQNP